MSMSESGLRSGQVADAAGVNVQTALLRAPWPAARERTLGGHRRYLPEAVTVLRVIKAAQRLGFSLDEVADLLEVSALRSGRRADAGLQARARVKLAEVDAKLARQSPPETPMPKILGRGASRKLDQASGWESRLGRYRNPHLPDRRRRHHVHTTRRVTPSAGQPVPPTRPAQR
jgi:MerR family mercuric resistance operon transcriptional regulator